MSVREMVMSAVQEGVEWWLAQMRDLLPQRMRQPDIHGDGVIADVQPAEPGVTLIQRQNRREFPVGPPGSPRARALAAGGARPRRVLLRVPASAVLERTLVLPLATEPELDRVVAYEIDRIFPFAAAEVIWTYGVDRRDRAAGRLHLRVALLPRAAVAPAIDTLRAQGLAPGAVLAGKTDGGTWRIGLDEHRPPGARQPGRRGLALGAFACAMLAVVAAGLPFLLQEAARWQTEAQIIELRPAVARAETLRRQAAERTSGVDAVAAEAARVGQALNLLATLTTLLPDDTYLTGLSMRQRVATLSGRSASAARLIPLLAADPAIRTAVFAAPVTRAEGVRGDLFSIRAEFGY